MPPDPEFYAADLTDASERVLERVVSEVPDATLIGGWGSWVRVRGPKSHDIDMIIDHADVDRLRALTDDMSTSDHLGGRKWRGTLDGIHLDLYVPYQSRLGRRLDLRAEDLAKHSERIDQWNILTIPAHTATKIAALLDRPDTMPGEKDRYEINRLLTQTDPAAVVNVISESSTHNLADLRDALTDEMFAYLRETDGLSKNDLRRLNTQRAAWATAIDAEVGRQHGDSGDPQVMDDATLARAKRSAKNAAAKNKPVVVKRSSSGGPPFTRSKPRKKK